MEAKGKVTEEEEPGVQWSGQRDCQERLLPGRRPPVGCPPASATDSRSDNSQTTDRIVRGPIVMQEGALQSGIHLCRQGHGMCAEQMQSRAQMRHLRGVPADPPHLPRVQRVRQGTSLHPAGELLQSSPLSPGPLLCRTASIQLMAEDLQTEELFI